MLPYKDKDIKKMLTTILNSNLFDMVPVGNHELGRNLVYKVAINGESKYIFKIYYLPNNRMKEIESFELLKHSNVRVPRVIKLGEENTNQWILLEYLEGEILEKIYQKLNINNQLSLFKEMGEQLGKIHSYQKLDFIGQWYNKISFNKYSEFIVNTAERRIKEITAQNLPDNELLMKAIYIMRSNYNLLDNIKESRIVHNDFSGRNILVIPQNGKYHINAIIDFEQSYAGNCEMDLVNLYYKYFSDNKAYEKAFIEGYKQYMNIDNEFNKKLQVYLIFVILHHCAWSYVKNNAYYVENIHFLRRLLQFTKYQ